MKLTRPMPEVGDKVRQDWEAATGGMDGNYNTWRHWGDVRAVVDDEVFVVSRRTNPSPYNDGGHDVYQLVTKSEWQVFGENYQHVRGGVHLGLDGKPRVPGGVP